MVPAIQSLPEHFQLVGIASRTGERAQACAAPFAVPGFAGYATLLEQSAADAVYIPLPNALHKEWISRALNAGCHVLVEKSLACSLSDVKALCAQARARNRVLMENFQFRYHRQFSCIQALLSDGALGELRSVRASFGFPPFADADNIRYQPQLGGGALLDAGAYPIKISQDFLGDQLELTAARWAFDDQRGIDLWGGGFIQQRDGALFAQIAFGFDHHYQCALELWGSKGKLFTNRIFTAPPEHRSQLTLETASGSRCIEVEPDNHFKNVLQAFHRAAQEPRLAGQELSANLRQATLIDAFRRMARGR